MITTVYEIVHLLIMPESQEIIIYDLGAKTEEFKGRIKDIPQWLLSEIVMSIDNITSETLVINIDTKDSIGHR